jgi:hypothetical protein
MLWIWILGAIAPMESYPSRSLKKDKYNSLFIVCCVCCIHVIMLLELSVYTYIYIAYMLALPASMTVHKDSAKIRGGDCNIPR